MLDDNRKQKIKEEVESAISQAKPWSEIEPHEKQEKDLLSKFLTHQISAEQFKQQIYELEDNIGTLHFYTITDFIYALECFHSTEEQIDAILLEQVPHYEGGVKSILPTRLSLTPYRTTGNQLVLIPGVQMHVERHLNEAEIRASLERIFNTTSYSKL